MEIFLLAKDPLEEQGIRWLVDSHFTGIKLTFFETAGSLLSGYMHGAPDLVILDMDRSEEERGEMVRMLESSGCRWLGISSERIFQTAYRALKYRAEDVLFRPLSPEELIKHIQQIRYQARNENAGQQDRGGLSKQTQGLYYTDLFLEAEQLPAPIHMSAFLTPNPDTLPLVYNELRKRSFHGGTRLFALSDFILCVQEGQSTDSMREEHQAFHKGWKKKIDEPLAIVMSSCDKGSSLKAAYQHIRQMTKRIFFEGYDIIVEGKMPSESMGMDPFLTPVEQRHWIEVLEKRDFKAIREWLEHEFLTYSYPYPDPEMVRIRMTSVLAQIRRYMKSHNLNSPDTEEGYHEVFQYIVHKPIIYEIVQELASFILRILERVGNDREAGLGSLTDKVRELIDLHYWNPNWSLAACADTLRMNKSTLSRRFAAEAGTSFRDLLHSVRLREAKRLLLETELPLEEIARLTGYTHQTYFSAKFKQMEGCTPSAYRYGISHCTLVN